MRTFGYIDGEWNDFDKFIKDVEGHVSETFGTKIHKYKTAILTNPEMLEDVKKVTKEVSGKDYQDNSYRGTCLFTRDSSFNADYLVTVKEVHDLSPPVMSEEITHGEHMYKHTESETGNYRDKYHMLFPGLSVELIGSLGFYSAVDEMKKSGVPTVLREFISEDEKGEHGMLDNYIAHMMAKELILSFPEIPYKDMFGAKDARYLWNIVSDVIGKGTFHEFKMDGPYTEQKHKAAMSVLSLTGNSPTIISMKDPKGNTFKFRYDEKRGGIEHANIVRDNFEFPWIRNLGPGGVVKMDIDFK